MVLRGQTILRQSIDGSRDSIDVLFEDSPMDEVKRTSLIVAGLLGCMFGATILGLVAMFVGVSLLSFTPAGIHSDWTAVVLIGILVCIVLGGVTGFKGATRLVKSWRI